MSARLRFLFPFPVSGKVLQDALANYSGGGGGALLSIGRTEAHPGSKVNFKQKRVPFDTRRRETEEGGPPAAEAGCTLAA